MSSDITGQAIQEINLENQEDFTDELEEALDAEYAAEQGDEPTLAEGIVDAVIALEDMGDTDSLRVLRLIDRILADDYCLTGLYEKIEAALNEAEGD